MVSTGISPAASKAGLMMIPPPMPQMVPRMQAKQVTAQQIKYSIVPPPLWGEYTTDESFRPPFSKGGGSWAKPWRGLDKRAEMGII